MLVLDNIWGDTSLVRTEKACFVLPADAEGGRLAPPAPADVLLLPPPEAAHGERGEGTADAGGHPNPSGGKERGREGRAAISPPQESSRRGGVEARLRTARLRHRLSQWWRR